MCVCVCVLRDEAVIDTTLKASFRLRQRLHYSSSSATLFSCRHLCVLSLLQMSLLTLCACIQFLVGWSFVTKLCSACTRSVCIRVWACVCMHDTSLLPPCVQRRCTLLLCPCIPLFLFCEPVLSLRLPVMLCTSCCMALYMPLCYLCLQLVFGWLHTASCPETCCLRACVCM